jgi:predicted N-acyltransferase
VEVLEGDAILPEHINKMFLFYLSTTEKKWGQSYLSADFFQRIYVTMRNRMVLILAYAEGECVAGTINFKKGDRLYGRYWGCNGNYRSLHFELCYYQPLEYAIRNGISLFEAGAQGEHKIQRGFLPELTYSAHWLEHPGFRNSIAKFLEEEKQAISRGIEEFSPHSPYRKKAHLHEEDERS